MATVQRREDAMMMKGELARMRPDAIQKVNSMSPKRKSKMQSIQREWWKSPINNIIHKMREICQLSSAYNPSDYQAKGEAIVDVILSD